MRAFVWAISMSVFSFGVCRGVPRYSVMYDQSCSLCHVDPSGGGARSLYGAQFFANTDLAMKQLPMEELGKIQPMLSDQVQIGFDGRTMFYGTEAYDQKSAVNTFMQMQGDLYVVFYLSPQWTFYLDKGLYSGFEIFGMGHVLPFTGYFKVGHFTPPYGMRLPDHKAFVRERLGFGKQSFGLYWEESGAEIGFHPEHFTFALAVTNGSSAFQDADEGKAVTARTDLRVPISDLNLWIGITGRRDEFKLQNDIKVDRLGGVYGGISYQHVFFLGEVDYRDSSDVKQLITFSELSWRLHRGVTVKVEYDFYDPDVDFKTGSENMYVGGFEIVPTSFLEFIPNLRYHDLEPGADSDYIEAEIQFHVFF